ncbi:MAG: trypsin-like peptidase domain-containing protein [Hyphomicrobiaceae bacterium]|nr:trypsin-like peptidase domain-containing protein [Hyphomicrobiaceae bacterium]
MLTTKITKSGLAVATLMACALTASAANAKSWLVLDETVGTVEGWTIGYSSGMAGCIATAPYKDKSRMWFGYSGKLEYFVALTNPTWSSVKPGTTYKLKIQLDNRGNWNGNFIGFNFDNRKGLASTHLKSNFIEQFAASEWLQVYASGKQLVNLSLDGSRAALQAIANCNAERREQISADVARGRDDNGGGDEQPRRYSARPNTAPRPVPAKAPQQAPSKEKPKIKFGTGFFVNAKGHVVTNEHVAGSCRSIEVGYSGGLMHKANLIASDKRNDLAVLKTDLAPRAVPSIKSRIRVGDDIYTYGFPLMGLLSRTGNFTVGYVTAAAGLGDDTSRLQISAPVQPGNSGGALVDAYGNIVGVVVAKLNALVVAKYTKDVPQNVNFAIKSSVMLGFLEANGIELPGSAPITSIAMETRPAAPAKLSPADVAERATKFTLRIICKMD